MIFVGLLLSFFWIVQYKGSDGNLCFKYGSESCSRIMIFYFLFYFILFFGWGKKVLLLKMKIASKVICHIYGQENPLWKTYVAHKATFVALKSQTYQCG